MRWILGPGFFSSQPVHVALLVGGTAATVSAIAGVFTVVRGQSFAGHALADVSTAGGSGALLAGIDPVLGFVGFGLFGAGVMEMIGVRSARGRDLATGIVLGASMGLSALVLYLETTAQATTGATQQILFGSLLAISPSTVPIAVGFGLVSIGVIAALYRPLVLSCASDELAAARGVRYRAVGVGFMAALAIAVGLSAIVVGAILSTALLVGPAASALRLTRRFGWTLAIACAIGVGITWLGVLLAYDSYYWGSSHRGLPVSFFIVVLALVAYLASGLPPVRAMSSIRERRASPAPAVPASVRPEPEAFKVSTG